MKKKTKDIMNVVWGCERLINEINDLGMPDAAIIVKTVMDILLIEARCQAREEAEARISSMVNPKQIPLFDESALDR